MSVCVLDSGLHVNEHTCCFPTPASQGSPIPGHTVLPAREPTSRPCLCAASVQPAWEFMVESRQWLTAPRRHWKLNSRKKQGFILFYFCLAYFFCPNSDRDYWNNCNLGKDTVLIFCSCVTDWCREWCMLLKRERLEILLRTFTRFTELNAVVNKWLFTTAPNIFLSESMFIVAASCCGHKRSFCLDSGFCCKPCWSSFS